MFAPVEIAVGLLELKLGPINLGQARRALDLQILVVKPAEQSILRHLVSNVQGQLGNPAIDLRSNRNLIRRANIPGRIDDEANIARLDRGSGRAGRCAIGRVEGRRFLPEEKTPETETRHYD